MEIGQPSAGLLMTVPFGKLSRRCLPFRFDKMTYGIQIFGLRPRQEDLNAILVDAGGSLDQDSREGCLGSKGGVDLINGDDADLVLGRVLINRPANPLSRSKRT